MNKLTKKRFQRLSKLFEEEQTDRSVGLGEIEAQVDHLENELLPASFWNTLLEDILNMMAGGSANGVREKYYPNWSDQDFSTLYDMLGRPKKVGIPVDEPGLGRLKLGKEWAKQGKKSQ